MSKTTAVPLEHPAEECTEEQRSGSIKRTRSAMKAGHKKVGSVRIQLTLKPKFAEKLDRLLHETDAASYSDVMRDAVRAYEWLVLEMKNGNQICSQGHDGTLTRLTFLSEG